MLSKDFVRSTTIAGLLFTVQHAAADTLATPTQILDDDTITCIEEAFGALDMPQGQYGSGVYGQFVRLAPVRDDYQAHLNVYLSRNFNDQDALGRTINFKANIDRYVPNMPVHTHAQSVTFYINRDDELTGVISTPLHSQWRLGDGHSYNSASFLGFEEPEYTPAETSEIEEWVEGAVNAMAFVYLHECHGLVFEPLDQSEIILPAFPVLASAHEHEL